MISNKTVNAIDLCVLLAGQKVGASMSTKELSVRLGLSISYLETILKFLKQSGIVLAHRGPGGGYMLRGEASLISIWDVASVFEQTFMDGEQNSEAVTHESYELGLEQVVINALRKSTLADFVDLSASEVTSYADTMGHFKFKPLPEPFVPKAPNSVFQLGAVP